jgi:hypothetical protein
MTFQVSESAISAQCLTGDQIAELLIADGSGLFAVASHRLHLQACAACGAEYRQLQVLFGDLRDSAVLQAEQEAAQAFTASGRQAALSPLRAYTSHRRALWTLAAAALTIAVTTPFAQSLLHRNTTHSRLQPIAAVHTAPVAAAPISDEALLDGISQDLSASVPTPMQPLANPAGGSGNAQAVDDGSTRRSPVQ